MSTKPLSSQILYETGTTAQDILDAAKPLASYTALRAYTGRATSVRITAQKLAGIFLRDDTDVVTADNGGTVIVDASGRRWKRLFSGAVSVHWFGAVGDNVTDDKDAIQAAINTGLDVEFPTGSYRANNLTQATNFQRFYANGAVNIIKNANGVLLSSTGNDVELQGIIFRGDTTSAALFTGDNLLFTGNNPRLLNCGSRWTPGLALKATGDHVQVIGTCDIYSTADASGTGYDIEIGVAGTATLYHFLTGIYASSSNGGIKFIDTGSHMLVGGQFGKLWIAAGTRPAGVNGGMTLGCRITVSGLVEQSNAHFAAVQWGSTSTLTFANGTSQCTCDLGNNPPQFVINNGNANNYIVRNTSPGSLGWTYGSDLWSGQFEVDQSGGFRVPHHLYMANDKHVYIKDSGGTIKNVLTLSSSNDFTVGDNTGSGNFMNIVSGDGGVYLAPSGTSKFQATTGSFRPTVDNSYTLGGASNRYSEIFAGNATINTSDGREKQQVRELLDAEQATARAIRGMIRAFKFNDAVAKKGDGARIHFGVIAQDVAAVFVANGLDPAAYSLFCYDEWDEQEEVWSVLPGLAAVIGEDGELIEPAVEERRMLMQPYRPAGNRYGIRYEELMAFLIAAL